MADFIFRMGGNYKKKLASNCLHIHHIGSTAVPGLSSKDKIDIVLQVSDYKSAIISLENLGFEYRGEWNIPFKYGFRYRHKISINLHMFDFVHPTIESALLFRDYLRYNSSVRNEYQKLKYTILSNPSSHHKSHPFLYNYTLRKSSFIKEILKKIGFSQLYIQYPADEEELKYIEDINKSNLLNRSK